MDLVDEEDIAVLQIGEQRGEVARLGDHRAGGGAEADPHLARDDLRERRLAESGRAEQHDVIERIAAGLRRIDEHAEVLARRALADELVECPRAERGIDILRAGGGGEEAVVGQ